jgi:hypothetical protein
MSSSMGPRSSGCYGKAGSGTSEAPLLAAALRRGFLAWSVVRAEEP